MGFVVPLAGALLAGGSALLAGSATAATIAAVGLTATSILKASKNPKAAALIPAPPAPENSLLKAQKDTEARRREALLSGGKVNLTGGTGTLLQEGQTKKKELLGA